MKRKKTIGIGIAGCGRIADLQCIGYHEHPQAQIIAVCDPDAERAKRCAGMWNVERIYSDIDQLLSDTEIEAIEILTPHHLHASHAVAALHAGKHVSLQKPPTLTLEELDTVTRAAKKSKKTVRVFENYLHYPPHIEAKKLIEKGAIGEPVSIRMKTAVGPDRDGWTLDPKTQAWREDPALCGGGPLTFDHGYHCFSMARFFMPVEAERVHAFIHWERRSKSCCTDGPALISWKYEGKKPRYGSWEVVESRKMKMRSDYYSCDERMEIHGTEGIVWVNCCTGKLLDEPSLVLYRDGETRTFHHIADDWAESFRLGGIDFVDALHKERQPVQDCTDARKTLAFAIAASKSAAENREVAISEIYKSSDTSK